jgi:hypothetical protein
MPVCIVDNLVFSSFRIFLKNQSMNTPRGTSSMEKGLTMSNFEPNAVIRGFQLTVVGSMSPVLLLHGLSVKEKSLFSPKA